MTPPDDRVRLAHGAGGRAMRALIAEHFLEGADPELARLADGAVVRVGGLDLVMTTDAHVVKPIEFPGGDLGRLSICGVVNDLAMVGATEVLALSAAILLEEGFPLATLARLERSARAACQEAGARIVTGDTKVMGRGELDGVVYSTTGLGLARRVVRDSGLQVGDVVLTTGTLGDHGLAVLSARHGLGLLGELRSDVAPLNGLIARALEAAEVHAMKDPTRGGLTSALSELASKAQVGIVLREASIPLSPAVRAASELLGVDPLAVANEGKALLGVAAADADRVLAALHAHPLGARAAVIGRVVADHPGVVLLDTGYGQRRLIERDGDPMPRIC